MYIPLFQQLDSLLTATRDYWQFLPFATPPGQWQHSYPEMYQWLAQLKDDDLQLYRDDPERLARALSPWIPEAQALLALSELKSLPQVSRPLPRGMDAGVPGRKWQQLEAFNGAMPALGLPWLEWCAGKGFLGRVLAASHLMPVTSLEWQAGLCEAGQAAAHKLKLPMTFVQGDAFSADSEQYIVPEQHAVALHACGDLHVSLLSRVARKKGQAVSVSPCCYHLIRGHAYEPMSAVARNSQLSLSKQDLKLPLQETVTAGNRVRNLRFLEVSYRLGFDSLQRNIRGQDSYLPVPNVQKALLNEGFEAFCRWAAGQKQLPLLGNIDFAVWQNEGEQRYHWVERLELVQQVFRRPLELWLVYDRACFMEEAGYRVSVGTFCDKPITPRNILIHAERIP